MKLRLLAASLAALTLASGAAAAQDTSTERGRLSYAIGYNTGVELAGLAARGESVDVATVVQAIQDAYARKEPTVPVEQLRAAVEAMQQRQQARMQQEFAQLAQENKTSSDAFLAQHRSQQGVQTLSGSTVQYRVLEAGSGARPTASSTVQLQYKGSLPDGTVLVDTNQAAEGQQPGPVTIAVSQIPLVGLREALLQMPTGARWEVVVPGDKAYGTTIEAGRMANQAVVFDVKLVGIN